MLTPPPGYSNVSAFSQIKESSSRKVVIQLTDILVLIFMSMLNNPTKAHENPTSNAMKLLNEIIDNYPNAISFASGRPYEKFYDINCWGDYVKIFIKDMSGRLAVSEEKASGLLGQYGKTQGIINSLVVQMLMADEGISTSPENIVVTCGAQEAMLLCLLVLCRNIGDAIVVTDPAYVGITGIADATRTQLLTVPSDSEGPDMEHIKVRIEQQKSIGGKVRALYLVPNYDSTTGIRISLDRRIALLDLCAKEKIFILEDNPYGLFQYNSEDIKNIRALDINDITIYIGSFAKSIAPGLRVGFLVLPNKHDLIESFVKIKSFTTLNTSQYNQAIVGGYLLAHQASLKKVLNPAIAFYKNNLEILQDSLERHFVNLERVVTWSSPSGGFFILLHLPFPFSISEMTICATDYHVIVIPLCCFSSETRWQNVVRLSFSYVRPEDIDVGVKRLKKFIVSRLTPDNRYVQ